MVNKLRSEGMSRQGGVESTHQSVYVCFASDDGGSDGMRRREVSSSVVQQTVRRDVAMLAEEGVGS
jgi:hypothetical protein